MCSRKVPVKELWWFLPAIIPYLGHLETSGSRRNTQYLIVCWTRAINGNGHTVHDWRQRGTIRVRVGSRALRLDSNIAIDFVKHGSVRQYRIRGCIIHTILLNSIRCSTTAIRRYCGDPVFRVTNWLRCERKVCWCRWVHEFSVVVWLRHCDAWFAPGRCLLSRDLKHLS